MTEGQGVGGAAWNPGSKGVALLGSGQDCSKDGVLYCLKRIRVLRMQSLGGMVSYSEENACPPIGKMRVGIAAVATNTENVFNSCILW